MKKKCTQMTSKVTFVLQYIQIIKIRKHNPFSTISIQTAILFSIQ